MQIVSYVNTNKDRGRRFIRNRMIADITKM